MKKRTFIIIGVAAVAIVAAVWLLSNSGTDENEIFAEVKRGQFEIRVFTTGELEAKNSIEIQGPGGLRTAGIWRVQISDIIAEGTVVEKGAYIASLDRTEISNKIKDAQSDYTGNESKYLQTKIDTTLELRQARENLVNLDYQLKEAQIVVEQSKYEPPATIRQAEIEFEKARNGYTEAVANYDLKQQQSQAKMQEVASSLQRSQNKIEMMEKVLNDFNIIAPETGMLIYKRNWNGKKKGVGSEITPWDPVVATLPDLTVMISKTYVNEVDIRKIKKDQEVEISMDAFPDKSLTGRVISVANVGEQLKNSDANVFEVLVQVKETDTTLRPSMTTGNSIIASQMANVLFVPLEAVHTESDTMTYVFVKSGFGTAKQEVELGALNDNYAVIKAGLEEGQQLLLSRPENAEDLDVQQLAMKEPAK